MNWYESTKIYELVGKLKKIKRTLQELKKDMFSEFERKVEEAMQKLQKYLESLQLDPCNIQLIAEETNLS